jgi:hypothetical protein
MVGLAVLALVAGRPLSASLARLTAPSDGDVLTSGSLAEVAWEEVALPPHAVEWEAFLSFDGGRSYPLRITPHLDLRLRRFSFQVPPFPTREARILLRFGDEQREEVEVETPHRFAIIWGGSLPPFAPLLPAFGLGESARQGDKGVLAWVEGTRSGHGLRLMVGRDASSTVDAVAPGTLWTFALLAPVTERALLAPPASSAAQEQPPPAVRASRRNDVSVASGAPVRLLIHRFNE